MHIDPTAAAPDATARMASDELFAAAGAARDRVFGREIFVRGVVEVSNYCRQNCNYCGMRRDNRALERFRLTRDIVEDIVLHARPPSITDINIQTGEDPVAVREIVIPLVRTLRQNTDLGISVCLGTLDPKLFAELHQAGADFYIIKLESGDPDHYRSIQAPGTLDSRIQAIRQLAASGWSVSSGFIAGLPGQTPDHIETTLNLLAALPLAGCSVSPFIPGEGTPYAQAPAAAEDLALRCLARMRLHHPHRIIPAVSAMNLVGRGGYTRALAAGANLATINLTPAGWRENYVLYKRDRFIMHEERVLGAIAAADCRPATGSLLGRARLLRSA